MKTGKSGCVEFTSNVFTAKVYWEETYDAITAESIVSITDVQFGVSDPNNYVIWYPRGTVSVDDFVVCTMSTSPKATHAISGLSTGFVSVKPVNGGQAFPWVTDLIAHEADGKKSVTISVDLEFFYTGWQDSWGPYPTISGSATVELTEIPTGLGYIDSGTSNVEYQAYIDNGSDWDLFNTNEDKGSNWGILS